MTVTTQVHSAYPHPYLQLTEPEQVDSTSRARFIVFLQILLRRLEASANIRLKQEVKRIVLQHTNLNRIGDSTPLVSSLQYHLRKLVGEVHWNVALRATRCYFVNKDRRMTRLSLKNNNQIRFARV
jgi:hypothetical protein